MSVLRLLAWLSPAFPTGGYAWSHGVEWAVECGDIRDGDTLRAWAADVLRFGAGRNDAILLRAAYSAQDADAVAEIVAVAQAAAMSRERLAETVGQGNAFRLAARAWGAAPLEAVAGDLPYPVAVGLLAAAHGIAEDDAVLGAVQAFAANLISAAVRLVPLGQSAGLAALAGLEAVVTEVAEASRGCGLDELGGCAFRSDLASLRHETQYTRLFRS